MKFFFFFLAVSLSGSTIAAPADPDVKNLYNDFKEFMALIPLEPIGKIVVSHMNDPEVKKMIAYLYGDEFKKLVTEVETIPEFNNVLNYLNATGLPLETLIQFLHDIIGVSPDSYTITRTSKSGGLKAMIEEIMEVINWDKIGQLYWVKMETNPDFKNMIDKINSTEFKQLTDALTANKRIQEISAYFTSLGFDIAGFVKMVIEFVRTVL